MIDSNYSEHHNFESEIFQKNYLIGETFNTLDHEFTFLGKGKLDHGLEPYFDLDIYQAKDDAGIEQYVGFVKESPDEEAMDEMQIVLDKAYSDVEFSWLFELENDVTLVPLESIEETKPGTYVVTPEIPIWSRKWVSVDPHEHVTRLGGYPSFGEAKEYGQPHGKNDSGEWKPLPFIAQYILPDGKFVHIYHVDDPEGYGGDTEQPLLDFGIENLHRSLVLIEGSVIPEGYCLMPVKDENRVIVTEKAVTVEGGNWPKSVAYIQGAETDEEFQYTLFHLPSGHGFGEDTDKMLTYTDTYIVWNGKDQGKLVEQYD
jgi:hypothetical protein